MNVPWLSRVLLILVCLVTTHVARAEPTEADRATARALAAEGYRALQDKQFEVAADRFRRADALVHAPTLVVDWARALVGLGQFVEAQEKYELVIREGVPKNSPWPFQRALKDAQVELEQIKPRLAWVTINVDGAPHPEVTIDGRPVPEAALAVRRAVNPGKRTIVAGAKGFDTDEETLELSEGEHETVELLLEPVSKEPEATETVVLTETPVVDENREQRRRTRRILTYTAFGVSGAGLVVGSVFGVLALNKRRALLDVCDEGTCDPASASDIDAYHSLGTVSAIGLGFGLAGAATGTILLLTDPDAQEKSPGENARRRHGGRAARGLSITPLIGFGSVGARGEF